MVNDLLQLACREFSRSHSKYERDWRYLFPFDIRGQALPIFLHSVFKESAFGGILKANDWEVWFPLSIRTLTLFNSLLNIYITVFALCLLFLHKSNSVANFIYNYGFYHEQYFHVPQMYTF